MKILSNKTYTVLIVNDNSKNQELTSKAFSYINFKFKILNVSSSTEAKSILENSNSISLVIINSSQKSIKEDIAISKYIREELSNSIIPILILSLKDIVVDIDSINRYNINTVINVSHLSDKNVFSIIKNLFLQYEQRMQLEEKNKDTHKQLYTDALTHLYNRLKLNIDCANKEEKTLILIDIVGFSKINENYGYDVGDSVLKEFAAFLYSMYHENFNIYHLDNDVFALIPLQNNTTKSIFTTVEEIKNDILKLNIITDNFNKTLDISIGVAYQSEKNILRKAELALKEARSNGINKIKYYSKDLKILKEIDDTNHWSPIIQEHLNDSSIVVHYQPIYNLKTYTIDKYELLMRIQHNGKLYLPCSFLDAAYKAGQMYKIFKFMFTHACIQAQKTGLKFSINIGDHELLEEGIVSFVEETLTTYKVAQNLLSLEILEYHPIDNNKLIIKNIILLHKLGLKIIIDDFGVNCSNFGQLQNLPISVIKIDGSFIQNIDKSHESQIIVKTIQTYAKEKNIKLVAEYVCNKEVLETVLDLDIEYGQGNYLGTAQEKISEF